MRIPVQFGGLFNSLAENKTPEGKAYDGSNFTADNQNLGLAGRYINIGARPNSSTSDIGWGFGYGKYTCNTIQALTVTAGIPTSGTIVLIWNGHSAAAVSFDATATDVQAALVALTDFESGEITCYGGPWPLLPIYAVWKGRYGGVSQALITIGTNGFNNSATVTPSTYVTGGLAEIYLAAVQKSGDNTVTLYKVTSLTGNFTTTTWTIVATGLTASDWFFQQYEDKIYAANSSDGISWFQLGGAWAGVAGITNVQSPVVSPSIAPAVTSGASDSTGTAYGTGFDFTSATFGSYVGWGSDPTVSVIGGGHVIKIVTAAVLNGDTVSFDITLNADSDWSYEDFHQLRLDVTTSEFTIDETSINFVLDNHDGSPVTLQAPFQDAGARTDGGTASTYIRYQHWGSKDRNLRDNIKKVRVTMTVPSGTSGKTIQLQIKRLSTWPNDQMATLDMAIGASLRSIEYGYTYLKTSNATESKISPGQASPVEPRGPFDWGGHLRVTCTGSASLTTSDYINVYRRDRFGLWRYLGRVANVTSGTTIFTDRNMLDELDAFPIFGSVQLPGGFLPTNIASWKGSLICASDRKVFISYTGQPLIFAPDPALFATQNTIDTTDPNIGRTAYVSQTRSEQVLGIVGQDSIYLSGPFTSYAMTNGDLPQQLSPPRPLPGSRGCLGNRAAYPQSGGAAQASFDGLWYYAVSTNFSPALPGTIVAEELSKDVRTTWTAIFGASPSNAVVVVHQQEIWAFTGTSYVKWTRNHQVERGALTDSVLAAIPSPANGLIFMTSKGKLMKLGASYTDDAGTAVTWNWKTGILDMPRSKLNHIELEYSGAPQIKIECWDGAAGYDFTNFDIAQGDGTVNQFPVDTLLKGYRYRVTVSGGSADSVSSLILVTEDAPGGRGN